MNSKGSTVQALRLATDRQEGKSGISKESARSGLSRLQLAIGFSFLLSAASGFYLLATDNSLWLLALSHAAGLIVIVVVDISLGVLNLAGSRRVYLPSLAAAALAVVLQLGDIVTAPQYHQTVTNFATYLFGLGAFDLLLALQFAVIGMGLWGHRYATYLGRRKSRRGKELDYSRRSFVRSAGIIAVLVGAAAALTSIKLPVSSVLQSTTTTSSTGAPAGAIAKASDLKANNPVYFEYPSGYPNMLLLHPDGTMSAVSLYCTHVCCECQWVPSAQEIACPCHGSVFDASGRLLQGPAYTDLPQISLRTDPSGYIFPTGVNNPGPCQV